MKPSVKASSSSSPSHIAMALALASFATLSAHAADTKDSKSAKADPAQETSLEEVVVTAQRRSERLQDVPMQVDAFSDAKIEAAGIKSSQDFVNMVPNVSLDDSFTYLNTFVVVRGVTQINNADSPVAIIVDGVPQNSQKQFKMNLFDIERIEVLKGPQGGLYGRNAIGGAINIVTKNAGDHFEGKLDASYGRGDAVDVSGVISTPVGQDGGLRVAGSYKSDGGRIQNSYTGKNVDFIDHDWETRGKYTQRFNDTLSMDLRASYRDFQAGAIYDSVIFSGRADDYVLPSENIQGLTYGNIFDTSAKFDAELGSATLTSITGYTSLTENYRGDLDFTNPVDKPGGFLGLGIQVGQGQDLGTDLFSQEFRLVSNNSGPFRWIAGVYYLNTKKDLRTRAFLDTTSQLDQIDTGFLLIDHNESNNNNAYAVYGSFDYDISEKLTLSGALRYDLDKRKQTDLSTGDVRKADFDSVQPKATLTYKFDDSKLIYGTFSTGFRSGGFNAPNVRIPVFKAENLDNFEAGFKTSWLDRRLILNGAVYRARSDNFQFFFVDAASAAQIIGNIDKVDIWGVELEVQALVGPGLQVFAGLGTTDSTIKENKDLPSTVGNKTPKTTNWSLNAGFQYDTALTDTLNLMTRVDYEHRGKKYWQVDNADVQGPVDLLGVRVGVETEGWGIYFTGKNLFNEQYYTDFNPTAFSGLDTAIGFRAQPSTWALEAKIKF
ncbi:TonB-dependent receptor [Kordiimonas marina]|uniref:TonB-dependent receptor n=1 Tax=Kordiimonas marina TaxID=2872312 RepID=UPI001FF50537|nr:TonB-dependent receptor [Kordiimonas marina]MCJ9430612.1 TonB-dependent receptor [Kordiimonas marina]